MEIGVIGWWSYDNQGDLAMLAAWREGLAPHHIVPIDIGFPGHPDAVYRLNRFDYLILGGGTLIPGKLTAPFDTFDRWADTLECPLGVAGLGVDPISEQHWPAVEALLDHAQFFYVRDRESHRLLREHPQVQVAPDLTFAYPLPPHADISGGAWAMPVCGVNLRYSAAGSLEFEPWLEALKRLPVQFRAVPFSSFGVFAENVLLKQLDSDGPEHFDPALYQQIDFMIGTAFHSILFAVQAAVPVIAIEYAPKVRHFMADNGLMRYLLAPDEHHRLSGLMDELLAERSEIVTRLHAIRGQLRQEAQRTMQAIRQQIEGSGVRQQRTGPQVTIAVIGSGNVEKDQRTQAACAAQTYENVEVLFVGSATQERVAARLQQVLTQSSGTYLTWIEGGECFAEDAVDCLVSRLERETACSVLYSDYWLLSQDNLLVGNHCVPEADKLYRRDVVGPCFLVRKRVIDSVCDFPVDSPLPAYSLWLAMSSTYRFDAFHAPLMYSQRQPHSPYRVECERAVRQIWRKDLPGWRKTLWRIVDSDFGERYIVKPMAYLNRSLRNVIRARR